MKQLGAASHDAFPFLTHAGQVARNIDEHDEWQATERRYLSEGSKALIDTPTSEEVATSTTNELNAA